MTLLSQMPGLERFNANMLRLNYCRIETAMDELVPESQHSPRVYTTKTRCPVLDGAIVVQYSRTNPEINVNPNSKLTVVLGLWAASLTVDDIKDESGNPIPCDSLRIFGRDALVPVDGNLLSGLGVEISQQDCSHKLFGLVSGARVELPGADIHAADDVAVTLISILESRSGT